MNKLPKDLWCSVVEFTEPKVYTLPDWVLEGIKKYREEKEDIFIRLSYNSKAIHYLEQNLDKVEWGMLAGNPSIYVVEKNETRNLIKKKVDGLLL